MNYEKKYKEVQKWVESIYTKLNHEHQMKAEALFPTLRESKGERIRETLIEYIKYWQKGYSKWNTDKDFCNDAIAWLERQGKQKPTWSEYDDKMMYYTNEFLKYHENSDPTATSCIRWLESLKPHNNIESKFKVGDWVVHNNANVYQVKKIDYPESIFRYELKNGYGDRLSVSSTCDYNLRNWTIQDAKDGDILVNGSNIFIFHYIYDKRIMGYCHVNTDDGRFYDDTCKIECFGLIDDIVKPATEEQCDSLIKAMTEAGYVFDFDKREFKKIEHSNEESNKFEPFYSFKNDNEYMCESIIDVLTNNTVLGSKGREIYSKYIEWLKSLRDIKILVEKDDEIKK